MNNCINITKNTKTINELYIKPGFSGTIQEATCEKIAFVDKPYMSGIRMVVKIDTIELSTSQYDYFEFNTWNNKKIINMPRQGDIVVLTLIAFTNNSRNNAILNALYSTSLLYNAKITINGNSNFYVIPSDINNRIQNVTIQNVDYNKIDITLALGESLSPEVVPSYIEEQYITNIVNALSVTDAYNCLPGMCPDVNNHAQSLYKRILEIQAMPKHRKLSVGVLVDETVKFLTTNTNIQLLPFDISIDRKLPHIYGGTYANNNISVMTKAMNRAKGTSIS